MLHIVNGDLVERKLRQGGLEGDILVWRELLTEGPAVAAPEYERLVQLRANRLERELGIPAELFARHGREQKDRLDRFTAYEELVLWFEHDLFDQTILWFLLHYFAECDKGGTKLSVMSIGEFPGVPGFEGFGMLSAEQLASLFGCWKEIGGAALDLGRRVWAAYAGGEPDAIVALLKEELLWTELPFAQDALAFHLSRFPDTGRGLGAVEATTLETLETYGPLPMQDLFVRVGKRHPLYGMGDVQYWGYLRRLCGSGKAEALIAWEGSDMGRLPGYETDPHMMKRPVSLTAAGRQVLRGECDAVRLLGYDRWLGGIHLRAEAGGDVPWRYDPSRRTLVRT
ncbi:RNA polymerase subunit sigma-24 [Paenibacillus chartarius]|uniref:RNA polymerase subunit sigma-24 n=1 Tax=Paenibacillus chartarius TaxID=747481 RepID=A0ABV6DRQ4_9BACL